jgi:uncharacterized protein YggE
MKPTNLRTITILPLAIGLIGAVGFSAPANAADTRYIPISATGSTSVVPDAVRITATVSVIGKTTKEALATAGITASAIRKALTANKISTKDVATQSLSVYPEYTYPANATPVLSCYRASQGFDITVRAASTASAVVDAIVSVGGDNLQINGTSPFVLDNEKATESARASAVKNAKAKAASYAKLLGVKLGKVIYLDETSTPTPYPVFGMTAKADDAATQIDLGEQKVTVSVTVRWSIG